MSDTARAPVADDFAGDVVLVTGAGTGLGRAYATYLAARGAAVVVNDVDGDRAGVVVQEVREAGAPAAASYGSVAVVDDAEAMVASAVKTFGRVDALVNNAGIGSVGRLERMSQEDIRRILDVQLLGTICG